MADVNCDLKRIVCVGAAPEGELQCEPADEEGMEEAGRAHLHAGAC